MNANLLSHAASQPKITITKWDLGKLDHLVSFHADIWSWRAVEFLMRELMRAVVVGEDELQNDIVTMRSQVAFREGDSEIEQVVTLTYPHDRDFFDDALSVLTPVGAALLGLSEGQSIGYPAPDGSRKTLTVLRIISQPERNGRHGNRAERHPC